MQSPRGVKDGRVQTGAPQPEGGGSVGPQGVALDVPTVSPGSRRRRLG